MPILIEGISIVARRDRIAERYPGGWDGFAGKNVYRTLSTDGEIAGICFMAPYDAKAFVDHLVNNGLVFMHESGSAVDIAIVDQRQGPTVQCSWIEFFRQRIQGGSVSAARLVGSKETKLYVPEGWQFNRSLSRNSRFIPAEDLANLEFVRDENGTKTYRAGDSGITVRLKSRVPTPPQTEG